MYSLIDKHLSRPFAPKIYADHESSPRLDVEITLIESYWNFGSFDIIEATSISSINLMLFEREFPDVN